VAVHLLVSITCQSLPSTTDNGARVDDAARLGVTTSVGERKASLVYRRAPSASFRPIKTLGSGQRHRAR